MDIAFNKEIVVSKTACRVLGVLVFVILTSLGSFVRIPLFFTPVPLTLQTFFVLLGGAFLGARLGSLAQAGYIILGIAGLPIFSGAGSGLFYLSGPTGGYIFGFVFASFFLGSSLRHSGGSRWVEFTIFCLADCIILLCGSLWLKILFGISLAQSLLLGFVPFIAGDLIKAFLALAIYRRLKTRINQVF